MSNVGAAIIQGSTRRVDSVETVRAHVLSSLQRKASRRCAGRFFGVFRESTESHIGSHSLLLDYSLDRTNQAFGGTEFACSECYYVKDDQSLFDIDFVRG